MNLQTFGVARLASQFRSTARNAEQTAEEEMARSASKAAQQARANAPRDTGEFAESITAEGSSVVATAEHARFVHDGTINMPPRPVIARAIEAEADDLEEAIAAEILDSLGF